ncbi:hypothetical protein HD554DRAFT_2178097 [Boletus coccyginus]|nr:hypothetical protein HD554DRAFT_2178097 [Boletus coccyginus]
MDPDGISPQAGEPTTPASSSYAAPSHSNIAAVAATVSVVGVLMAVLITWLVVRLRRAAHSESIPVVARRPTSNASYIFRPSFAPSEASSRFGFIRKPLRISHRHQGSSWDFADPDPLYHQKESPLPSPRSPSQKHRPAPLAAVPAYRLRTHKDEFSPRTPTTPGTPASIEPPPPAYCRESAVYHTETLSPS